MALLTAPWHIPRLAAEIEGTVDESNVHRMMERLGDKASTDFDEEELYGAVLGSGRTTRTDVSVPGAGGQVNLSQMFQSAQVDGQGAALPAMPQDAIVFGGIAPPPPNPSPQGTNLTDATASERLKVRSILSQNEGRKAGKDGNPNLGHAPISPEIKAQFNEFKAKQLEQDGMALTTTRAQTTENLRAFSQSQKQKEDAKKEAAGDKPPAKKLTLNPNAKSFTMSVKAKAFVPMSKKAAPAAAPAPNPQGAPPQPRPQGFPPQGPQGFGPGGYQQGFPQPMQQMPPPQGFQAEMAPVEGIFTPEHKLLELYAEGMGKMLQSTTHDPEKNSLPGWPYGNVGFRTADEATRQGQPMAQAPPYQMQMGPQGGYPSQQMPMMAYPQSQMQGYQGQPMMQQQQMMNGQFYAPQGQPMMSGMAPQGYGVPPAMMQQGMPQHPPPS